MTDELTTEEKAFYKVLIRHAALFVDSDAHTEIVAAFERAIAQAKTPGHEAGRFYICKRCGGQVSPASPPE